MIWRRSLEHVFELRRTKTEPADGETRGRQRGDKNLSLKDSEILCGILAETLDVGNVRG